MPVDSKYVVYHGSESLWLCDFGKMREIIEFVPRYGGRDCDVRYWALPDGQKLNHKKEYQIPLETFARQAVERLIPKR